LPLVHRDSAAPGLAAGARRQVDPTLGWTPVIVVDHMDEKPIELPAITKSGALFHRAMWHHMFDAVRLGSAGGDSHGLLFFVLVQ
jgi:hypothetical protein